MRVEIEDFKKVSSDNLWEIRGRSHSLQASQPTSPMLTFSNEKKKKQKFEISREQEHLKSNHSLISKGLTNLTLIISNPPSQGLFGEASLSPIFES